MATLTVAPPPQAQAVDPLDAALEASTPIPASAPAPAPAAPSPIPALPPAPASFVEAMVALTPPATATAAPAPVPAPSVTPAPAQAKRVSLFDLEAEYLSILMTLDEGGEIPDATLAALADKLQQADEQIDRKVEGWAKWITQLERDGEVAKAEAARLSKRGGGYEKFADRLRETLKNVLINLDKLKVKTALYTVNVQKAPASVATVSIPDLAARFLKPPAPPEADRKAILDEWKKTKVAPAGVTIRDDGKTLVIR